jgi:hypothetical protein
MKPRLRMQNSGRPCSIGGRHRRIIGSSVVGIKYGRVTIGLVIWHESDVARCSVKRQP